MFVALRGCRITCNGRYPRWNNDRRFRVTLGNCVIDDLAIVRSVRRHVIGDGDLDLGQVGDRSQQTLGLSQWLMEDQGSARLVSMAIAE